MRFYAVLCASFLVVFSSCATLHVDRSGSESVPVLPDNSTVPLWQKYSEGIKLYRYTRESRRFSITALKIDLSSRTRSVVISRGIEPLESGARRYNFLSTTVKGFMKEEGLVAAINATPFEPYRFLAGLKQSAVGVVKSDGVLYSSSDRYDAVCFTGKNGIVMDSPPFRFLAGSDNAAGGFFIILSDGCNVAFESPAEARSLAGADKSGNTLILAVIDGGGFLTAGRGATFYEAAEWMKYLGAENALCLDGGGSSVIAARKNNESRITVLNNPEGGMFFFFKRLAPVFIGIR